MDRERETRLAKSGFVEEALQRTSQRQAYISNSWGQPWRGVAKDLKDIRMNVGAGSGEMPLGLTIERRAWGCCCRVQLQSPCRRKP